MRKLFHSILFFLMFIFAFQTSNAQCEYEKNEMDEFTGKRILITDPVSISPGINFYYGLAISFIALDKSRLIRVSYTTDGSVSLFVSSDDKLYLKLLNDSVIILNPVQSAKTDFFTAGLGRKTSRVSPSYLLSNELIMNIRDVGIAKARMLLEDRKIEKDFKSKDNNKLAKAIDCFFQLVDKDNEKN